MSNKAGKKACIRWFRKFWIVLIFVAILLPKQGISEEKNGKSVFDEKSVNLKIKIDKDKIEYQIFAYVEPGTPMTWCGDDILVIGNSAESFQKKLRIISLKDIDLFQYNNTQKMKVKEINIPTENIYNIIGCTTETDTIYLEAFDDHIYALNLKSGEIKKILANIEFKAFDALNNILVVIINNKSYIDNQFLRNDGIKLIKMPNSFDVNWVVLYILPNNKLLMYKTGKFYIYDYQLNKLTELGKSDLRFSNYIDHQILCDYDYKNNKFFILCWDIDFILKSKKGQTIKPKYTIEVPSLSDFKVISSQVLIYAENKKNYDYLYYYYFPSKEKELFEKYHSKITNVNPFYSEKPCSYCFTQSSVTGSSLAYLLKDRIVIITYR